MAGSDETKPLTADAGPIGAAAEEHIEHDHMHQETPTKGSAVAQSATSQKYGRTVLIALDGSASGEQAFQWAVGTFVRFKLFILALFYIMRYSS